MIMKLTLYNDNYEFSEILDDEYIEEYNLVSQEEFDVPIEWQKLKVNHPFAHGWLECILQSTLIGSAFDLEYGFGIKFTKDETKIN